METNTIEQSAVSAADIINYNVSSKLASSHNNTTTLDMGMLLDKLLSNDYISEPIRIQYWSLFSNSLKLSNLSNQDILWLINQYDLLELRIIRSLRGHDYDINFVTLMTMLKQEYYANLNRAKNGFERQTQATQIYSTMTDQNKGNDPVHSTGFLAQIKRFIGGQ